MSRSILPESYTIESELKKIEEKKQKFKSSILIDNNQIDILSPTKEEAKKIIQRCKDVENHSGFLFFLLNFVVVPHITRGSVAMKDDVFIWQIMAAIEFVRNKSFIFEKPRQTSATTLTVAYLLWRAIFFDNQSMIIISLTQKDAYEVIDRLYFIYDRLPTWLKIPKVEDAKGRILLKNGSGIKALPGKSKNSGRGQSASVVVLDEFAFMDYASNILANVVPALSTGMKTPFSNNAMPSQLFVISTFPMVNDEKNEYMRLYTDALDKSSDSMFKLIKVDTSDIPQYQDEEWHRNMLSSLGEKKYLVEVRGILDSFIDSTYLSHEILSGLKPSPPIRINFLRKDQVDEEGYPIDFDNFYSVDENFDADIGFIKGLHIWDDPMPGREYGMACDVAAGGGGDCNAFHVFDLETYEQVAEFMNNKVSTERYKLIIEMVARHYNDAKISIESNAMGISVVSYFAETISYPNLYWTRKSKKVYVPGFFVGSNRPNILGVFSSKMSDPDCSIKINSVRTINQLKIFGWDKNGRVQGLNKAFDDLVTALAQFCFLMDAFHFSTKNSSAFVSDEFLDRKDEEKLKIIESHYGYKTSDFFALKNDLVDIEDADNLEVMNMMIASGGAINIQKHLRKSDEILSDIY